MATHRSHDNRQQLQADQLGGTESQENRPQPMPVMQTTRHPKNRSSAKKGLSSTPELIKSGSRQQDSYKSNESIPIRSAQEQAQASIQSGGNYNYDFLYDPENQSHDHHSNSLSPHVFMASSIDNDPRMKGSNSSVEKSSGSPGKRNDQQQPPASQPMNSHHGSMSPEEQYEEEVYYIEEEIEEEVEEEIEEPLNRRRSVEVIPEVDEASEQTTTPHMSRQRLSQRNISVSKMSPPNNATFNRHHISIESSGQQRSKQTHSRHASQFSPSEQGYDHLGSVSSGKDYGGPLIFQQNQNESQTLQAQANGTAVFPFNQHLGLPNSNLSSLDSKGRPKSSLQVSDHKARDLSAHKAKKKKRHRSQKKLEIENSKQELMVERQDLRMIMKDLILDLTRINDVFYRKKVHQEMILDNQSQLQSKSLLDIILNSNQLLLTDPQSSLKGVTLDELRDKSNSALRSEVKLLLDRLMLRIDEYTGNEQQVLHSLAKERERNQILETELIMKDTRIMQLSKEDSPEKEDQQHENESVLRETEQYVTELEAQLQKARQDLLSTKLELSDNQVELKSLKSKLEAQGVSVGRVIDEKKSLEESFANLRQQLDILQSEKFELSQLLRDRESTLLTQQTNYQSNNQALVSKSESQQVESSGLKSELQRQIADLNRQIYESHKHHENLEEVERNLIEKLDHKEEENYDLKSQVDELKTQLDIKAEAISKAQKIIERLNHKSGSDDGVVKQAYEQSEQLKKEVSEKQKVIQGLHQQLEEAKQKTLFNQTQIGESMNQELSELRKTFKEYQLDMENEKIRFSHEINNMQDLLRDTEQERDQIAAQALKKQGELSEELLQKTSLADRLQLQLDQVSKERTELLEESELKYKLLETNANNQIQYLQRRIKEIAEETQSDSGRSTIGRRHAEAGVIVQTCKRELDKLAGEVISVREAIREELGREDAMVNQRLSKFDEFRLQVLDQLILWDEKTVELAALASRYHGQLDEQKKLFLKVKLVVQEKDQVISELQKQLVMREQSQQQHFNEIKGELIRANQVMRDEFLETIALLERRNLEQDKEILAIEERSSSFRQEYTQILEERNHIEREYQTAKVNLQIVERDFQELQNQTFMQNDKYSELLNIKTLQVNEKNIEHAMRNIADDARRYSAEVVSLRDQLTSLTKDREEEKELLNQKLSSLEEQYTAYQSQAIEKEEQQQLEFVEKENLLTQELQAAQAFADKCSQEMQTRERQMKRLQEKQEEDHKRYADLNAQIQDITFEKQAETTKVEEAEAQIRELQEEVTKLKGRLQSNSELLELQREDVKKERLKTADQHLRVKELEADILREQESLSKAREQFIELETKMKSIEQTSTKTSKELQEAYKTMNEHQQVQSQLSKQRRELERDVEMFKSDLEGKEKDIKQLECEIQQYQGTIMRQTRELEELGGFKGQNGDLKRQIESIDALNLQLQKQVNELQAELQGPIKHNAMTQTIDSGMLELQYARQEVFKSQQCQEIVYQENNQLKEALERSTYEVCRLIEDKRELEDLIEKLNKSINQHKQQAQNTLMYSKRTYTGVSPERGTDPRSNITSNQMLSHDPSQDVLSQVLVEKENYIQNLEGEITEMRREIDRQRDQLIGNDIGSMSELPGSYMSMSLGGKQQTTIGQQSSYQMGQAPVNSMPVIVAPHSPQYLKNLSNPAITNLQHQQSYTRETIPLRDRSGSRERQEILHEIPNRLHGTHYSTLTPTHHSQSNANYTQHTMQVEDRENTSYNKYPVNVSHNMHNDTTVNNTQMMLDNTCYTNHGRGDASFLNPNDVSASKFNTVNPPPQAHHPSPTKGTFYVNA